MAHPDDPSVDATGTPTPLASLVERLWGPPGLVRAVVDDDLPPTHVVVEDYAVVGRGAARYLFPLDREGEQDAAGVVRAGMTRQLSTPSLRSTALGVALAGAWSTAPGRRRLTLGRLRVGIDASVPRAEWSDHLLLARVARDLDVASTTAIVPVRRQTPNAKPTLRLFGAGAAPLGFAKLGWSPPTSALVAAETTTLADLGGRVGSLTVPRVAAAGAWADRRYLVAAPLPGGLRPWDGHPGRHADDLRAISASDPDHGAVAWGDAAWTTALHDRMVAAETSWPDEAGAVRAWLDRLRARSGERVLELGRWHGDWVPWNVARRGTGASARRYAWDWEYAARGVPLGFDTVHWHVQSALAAPSATLLTAAPAADGARGDLAALGIAPADRDLVVSLYLLELLARAVTLAAEGAGWNPKLQPHLAAYAAGRDA